MNTIATDVIPARQRTKPSPFSFAKITEKWKFNKAWSERNYDNSDVFLDSLELVSMQFQQYIFVEESKELLSKLNRIGFTKLDNYPDKKLFDKFCYLLYNEKHNVALSVYKADMKRAIELAGEIAQKSEITGETELAVFLAAVRSLTGNVK